MIDEPDFDPDKPCILEEMQESSDLSVIREIIDMYVTDVHEQLAKLQKAVEMGHIRAIADIAHTMAGSAATFGLKRVWAEAKALEKAAERCELPKVSALNQDLRTSLPLGLRALNLYFEGCVE
jgi:HPt (histidine-containing phosphotransfer) domain-containing protein